MTDMPIHIIKLGGSLLDLPDLPERWAAFADVRLVGQPVIIVGGGTAADTVRSFDQRFDFDETVGHWLAVHAMQFNARLVATTLPNGQFVPNFDAAKQTWHEGNVPVIDPVAILTTLEKAGVTVPHRWIFTSDSIAALVATQWHACRLTLLKSTLPKGACNIAEASCMGIVDDAFPSASREVAAIDLINLRHESIASPAAQCVLR